MKQALHKMRRKGKELDEEDAKDRLLNFHVLTRLWMIHDQKFKQIWKSRLRKRGNPAKVKSRVL